MATNRKTPQVKRPTIKHEKSKFPDFETGEQFEALSAADKERVATYYSQGHHRSETRSLSAQERSELKNDRAKVKNESGRIASGSVKVISLSVRIDLLKRADAYAKAHGLGRAELVAQALNQLLPILP